MKILPSKRFDKIKKHVGTRPFRAKDLISIFPTSKLDLIHSMIACMAQQQRFKRIEKGLYIVKGGVE